MPIFSCLCVAINNVEQITLGYVERVGTCSTTELLSNLNQTEEVEKTTLYWYLNKLTGSYCMSRISGEVLPQA